MDTLNPVTIPTVPGQAFEGGLYVGRILVAGAVHGLIVAPKAEGEHAPIAWHKKRTKVPGAMSFFDGRGNTMAMADAGSEAAKWALDLRIGGFDDWYLPSRDELELCYRNLKPTAQENWCYRGDNPSSVPVGYSYLPEVPAQTEALQFKAGGEEAFEDAWYWSSTQYAGTRFNAWNQGFSTGDQNSYGKDYEGRCRAVRRFLII